MAFRLVHLALLVLALWIIGLGLNAVIHWLPFEANLFVTGLMLGFFAGGLVMERAQQQLYVHGNPDWPLVRIKDPVDHVARQARYELHQKMWFGWTIAGVLAIIAAIVVIVTSFL